MTPAQTWLFLLVIITLVLSATFHGGRAWDYLLDNLFGDPRFEVFTDDCPCSTDRDYHERERIRAQEYRDARRT